MSLPLEESPNAPPFSLAYLFSWITLTALLMGWFARDVRSSASLWEIFVIGSMAAAHGAAVQALLLRGIWGLRRRRVEWEPGHVLLFLTAGNLSLYLLQDLAYLISESGVISAIPDIRELHPVIAVGGGLLRTLMVLAVLAITTQARKWRVLLAVVVVSYMTDVVRLVTMFSGGMYPQSFTGFNYLQLGASGAAVIALVLLLIKDIWLQPQKRDWLHWTGIAVWIVTGSIGIVRLSQEISRMFG